MANLIHAFDQIFVVHMVREHSYFLVHLFLDNYEKNPICAFSIIFLQCVVILLGQIISKL